MATATLKMKKATKSALANNDTLLRTKTFQRAANLLKHASDATRLQVIHCSPGMRHHVGAGDQLHEPACSGPPPALLRHGESSNVAARARTASIPADTAIGFQDRQRRYQFALPLKNKAAGGWKARSSS
jgi:hypothetical protein